MISVPPFALEICVVCVGIFLLMMDCFTKVDKLSLGWAAISGLLAIIVLSFLTGPMPKSLIIPQDFYVVDQPALFKRFILLSTILTICLAMVMPRYTTIYRRAARRLVGRIPDSADFHMRGLDVDGLRRTSS
jgi:NADH:ubiquinone oxidoreductase subunit 2 (subunit N)